ncbi:hypothetical protein ACO0QE_004181 [Hanseniaspora vineae]
MEHSDKNTDPVKQTTELEAETPSKMQQRAISETTGLYHLKLSSKNTDSADDEKSTKPAVSVASSLSPKRSLLNVRPKSLMKKNSTPSGLKNSSGNRLNFYDENGAASNAESSSHSGRESSSNSSSRRASLVNASLLSSGVKSGSYAASHTASQGNTPAHSGSALHFTSDNTHSSNAAAEKKTKNEPTLEDMLLELAKKERRVVELENELTLAKKQLKEFELECRHRLESNGMVPLSENRDNNNNNNSKTQASTTSSNQQSTQTGASKNSMESDLLSKWTHKLKETTDELLQIGGVTVSGGTTTNEDQKSESADTEKDQAKKSDIHSTPGKNPSSLQAKPSLLQLGFDKFSNILGELYEEVEPEESDKKTVETQNELDKSAGSDDKVNTLKTKAPNSNRQKRGSFGDDLDDQQISKSSPYYNRKSTFFDKLKNKINEFTLYEEDEEEYDRVKDKKLDKMIIVDDFQDCSIITTDQEEEDQANLTQDSVLIKDF